MKARKKNRFMPGLEIAEQRCLTTAGLQALAPAVHASSIHATASSLAVITFRNDTNDTVNFQFRWRSTDSWQNYSVSAHYSRWFWISTGGSLSPQIRFDWSYSSGFQEKRYSLNYNLY